MNLDIFNKTATQIKELETIDLVKKENSSSISALNLELKSIINGAEELIQQGDVLKIGIVGQVKAGKSSFLNALLFEGQAILPKAVTPMTAGLTVIRYADELAFEAEFYSKTDWDTLVFKSDEFTRKLKVEKERLKEEQVEMDEVTLIQKLKETTDDVVVSAYELVTQCSTKAKALIDAKPHSQKLNSIEEWKTNLENYVGANGEFTSVTKCLYLYMPHSSLKGIEIVDTPGVNDPVVSRGERTNEFLRSCHGVFMLSNAEQFCSSTDMTFLNERVYNQGIEAVVVLASKYDSALVGVSKKYNEDLENACLGLNKDLESQLKKALANKKINVAPSFDHVSGMCHALYKKSESQWNEEEKHIANQLSKRYPVYFENDIDETFKVLGNINDIQKKYVVGEFTANKEKIVSTKQIAYFCKNKENILELLASLKEKIEGSKKLLNNLDIEQIESYKENANQVEDIARKSNKFLQNIANEVNDLDSTLFNTVSLKTDSILKNCVIRTKKDYEIYRSLWMNDKKEIEINSINYVELRSKLNESFEGFKNEVLNHWKELFKSKQGVYANILKEDLAKIIKANNNIAIQTEILKEALESVLAVIETKAKTLVLDNVIIDAKKSVKDKIKSTINFMTSFNSSDDVDSYFKNESDDESVKCETAIIDISHDLKQGVQNVLKENKEKIYALYASLIKSFEVELSNKYKALMSEYEQKVHAKEQTLEQYEKAINLIAQTQKGIIENND